ncbi:hypothetical protein D3C76_1368320 [compost metagenome]
MVVRLVIMAAFCREAKGAGRRGMPRQQPGRIGKVGAGRRPVLMPRAGMLPDQIAQRRSEPAAMILGIRSPQLRRRVFNSSGIYAGEVMGQPYMHTHPGQ